MLDLPPKLLDARSRKERRQPLQDAFKSNQLKYGFLPTRIPTKITELRQVMELKINNTAIQIPLIIRSPAQPQRISPADTIYNVELEPWSSLHFIDGIPFDVYVLKQRMPIVMRSLGTQLQIDEFNDDILITVNQVPVQVMVKLDGGLLEFNEEDFHLEVDMPLSFGDIQDVDIDGGNVLACAGIETALSVYVGKEAYRVAAPVITVGDGDFSASIPYGPTPNKVSVVDVFKQKILTPFLCLVTYSRMYQPRCICCIHSRILDFEVVNFNLAVFSSLGLWSTCYV